MWRQKVFVCLPLTKVYQQKYGVDTFILNDKLIFLLVIYFSNEVSPLKNLAEVIQSKKKVFFRFGVPQLIFTDNGSQFTGYEFKVVARTSGLNRFNRVNARCLRIIRFQRILSQRYQ